MYVKYEIVLLASEKSNAGQQLTFLAGSWGCAAGKSQEYLLVNFFNGGNCEQCERFEIVDLKGQRLTPDGKNFSRKYERLGLPKPFPKLRDIELRK